MTRKRASEVLGRLVDTKTARLPYAREGRVEGRNTDGTTRLRFLGGTCEARLGITAGRKGEVTLAEPTGLRSRGTAGVPTASLGASHSSLWIERLERQELGEAEALNQLLAGEDVTVTVIGRGFLATTRFEFLLPETLEANPHIIQVGQRYLDSEHVELDLRIDAASPVLDEAPLAAEH